MPLRCEIKPYGLTSYHVSVCLIHHQGTSDTDYSLYPRPELQRDWLTAYLESYKHSVGLEATVTELEVQKLYVQVCKFSLVRVNGTVPIIRH